ncbi:polymorphic toxin-type HINT domain-containing protein [Nonomuraea sp. SYSU D8015]|uniref:polymorphic toxin-type HINT domain-containing protein n=1 Tax=Nonomuraea sp. SYSU D8015 TaxID=2593644 RepID=UPI0016608163|nr:polymorphic toxin-type HINT domain-containing protein [Nonomuraea sp. SYSU D8015]
MDHTPLRRSRRRIRSTSFLALGSLIVTFLVALSPAAAAADRWDPPEPQEDRMVEGTSVPVRDKPADPAEKAASGNDAAVAWPGPGAAEADLTPAGAARQEAAGERPALVELSGLPVRVGPATGTGAPSPDPAQARSPSQSPSQSASGQQPSPSPEQSPGQNPATSQEAGSEAVPRRVRVEILERADREPAAADEVRLRVTRADGAGEAAPVTLRFDYSAFRHAYGGDWAARLRLVELPACALTGTPGVGDCPAPRPLATTNDVEHATLTADVAAAPTTAPTTGGTGARAAAAASGLYAVAAAPSGATGNFTASTLAPTAKWQVSAQTGDFSWSYPLRTPPSLGGPTPQLALTYSAGSVDGRTASTNNQPSWVGEGFDFTPGGFIERKYKSCNDDGVTPKTGEQCWAGENATLMLGGSATELVRDSASGAWRPKNDDGSRVEKLTGAANGDGGGDHDKGEHWKVTAPDGTQYFFGLNRLPGWSDGKRETRSAWTTPVFGDDSGEPCNRTAFADSWCRQAYRWNLDHVIDTRGNTMSYFYAQETNHYGRNVKAADETPYAAGGYLERIEYGQRAGQIYTAPATARVEFTVAERCLPTSAFDCAPAKLTPANAAHWPDVPADQLCAAGADCTNFAPTFFTRKRLSKVTTQVWNGTAYEPVDSWTLTHTFPKPGDNMNAALWLERIQHTGHVGGSASTPAVDFDGVEMPNRVDGLEGIAPMMKWRIRSVNNETGGRLTVNYSGPECTRAALAQAHANGKRCFPTYWSPEGATDPYLDWFHKYVATQVLEADLTGGSPIVQTDYAYLGSPAWAYDDQELVPHERRTWSQWRGYEKVQVTKGDSRDQRTATEHLFFRGMHGDRQPSGTRSAQVTDSEGAKVDDHWRLAGFERETRYLHGPGGAEQSGTINDPWLHGPTASGGGDQAYKLDTAKVRGRTKISTGAWRRTETRRAFDSYGVLTELGDLGDIATPDDDRCTRYSYARNTTAWILTLPSRTETVAVACTETPTRPGDVIGDGRMFYDGATTHGAAPSKGDLTRVEELESYDNGQPRYVTVSRSVYDAYGRITEVYDAADQKTTTAYSPAAGGPVTKVTTTNPLGHTETTWLKPAWGAMSAQEDANGRRTELAYDPLGRLSKVWLPGRSTAEEPNGEFSYTVRTNGPVAVTTKTLRDDGTYTTGHELYDGLLRLRQTQLPAHGGGRLLADTVYNTLGQVAKKNDLYANADPPSTAILGVADSAVPAQKVYAYDGLGRTTAEVFKVVGAEKWRTTTAYHGDRVDVDPPRGGTPTSAILDGRGRTVELRQYKGDAPTGEYDATKYTYGKNGEEETVTDSAGNVWRTHYDLRNRVSKTEDPDKGTTGYTYDALGQVASTTDARGRTLAYVYDKLGRRTAMHEGSASGPKLAGWTYDTLPDGTQAKGLPVASTRYSGGQAYTVRVDAYDVRYRPTAISYVIPSAAEGALGGTYQFKTRYNLDGTVQSVTHPAAGNLPAETVRTTYSELGLPVQTRSSLATYVSDTLYSKRGEPLQERWGAEGARVLHDYTYEEGTRRVLRHLTDRETTSQVRQADLRYTYDEAGSITKIADTPPAGNAPSDVQCFTYDHLRRLSEAWTATDGCASKPATNVIGGAAPYWHTYEYDKTGGRTKETRHAFGGATVDTTVEYEYPAAGRPHPHALTQATTTGPGGTRLDTYSHDAAGNMEVRKLGSAEQRLEWDSEGRLTKVTEGGKATAFLYDADGNRLIRRDPAGTTLYLAGMELRMAAGATAATAVRYYGHGAEPVAVRTDDQRLTWLVPDHNGTAQMAVDATSLQVTRRRFDPFGNPRGTMPASWPAERGFVGGTTDASIGLTHLGAREYDASTGRFISVDPVIDPSDPQNLNGYAYSANNPVTFTDPSGMREVCGMYPGECDDTPDSPSPGGGSSGGGNTPPKPPAGGPSGGDQDEAKRTLKKSWMDVAIETGGKLILDIIGFTDVRDCLGGSIGACASAVVGIVPWGKIAKTLKAAYRAAKAVLAWYERVKWARRVMREADEAAAAAAKYQDDLAKWQKAQEAANAAKKAEAGPAGGGARPGGGGKSGPKTPTTRERGTSCANSFVPGTAVLMADGTRRPIEEVGVGDKVLATDPETGESSTRPVVATIIGDGDKRLVEITVDTDGAKGDDTGVVVATHNHPFWVDDKGRWIEAADLRTGDIVLTSEAARLSVISLHERIAGQRVHNLTVDGVHTYYVTAGDADVLVHNCPSGRSPYRGVVKRNADGEIDRESVAQAVDPHRPRTLTATIGTAPFPAKVIPDQLNGERMLFPTVAIDEIPKDVKGWRKYTYRALRIFGPFFKRSD